MKLFKQHNAKAEPPKKSGTYNTDRGRINYSLSSDDWHYGGYPEHPEFWYSEQPAEVEGKGEIDWGKIENEYQKWCANQSLNIVFTETIHWLKQRPEFTGKGSEAIPDDKK